MIPAFSIPAAGLLKSPKLWAALLVAATLFGVYQKGRYDERTKVAEIYQGQLDKALRDSAKTTQKAIERDRANTKRIRTLEYELRAQSHECWDTIVVPDAVVNSMLKSTDRE